MAEKVVVNPVFHEGGRIVEIEIKGVKIRLARTSEFEGQVFRMLDTDRLFQFSRLDFGDENEFHQIECEEVTESRDGLKIKAPEPLNVPPLPPARPRRSRKSKGKRNPGIPQLRHRRRDEFEERLSDNGSKTRLRRGPVWLMMYFSKGQITKDQFRAGNGISSMYETREAWRNVQAVDLTKAKVDTSLDVNMDPLKGNQKRAMAFFNRLERRLTPAEFDCVMKVIIDNRTASNWALGYFLAKGEKISERTASARGMNILRCALDKVDDRVYSE